MWCARFDTCDFYGQSTDLLSCASATLDLTLLSQHVSFWLIGTFWHRWSVYSKGKVHCISEATGFPQKMQWFALVGKASDQGTIPEDPMPHAAEDSGETHKSSPIVLRCSALVCGEWGICVVQQVLCLVVTAISKQNRRWSLLFGTSPNLHIIAQALGE